MPDGQTGPSHSLSGTGGQGQAWRGTRQPSSRSGQPEAPRNLTQIPVVVLFVTTHNSTPEGAAAHPRSQSLRIQFHRFSPPEFCLAVSRCLPCAGTAGRVAVRREKQQAVTPLSLGHSAGECRRLFPAGNILEPLHQIAKPGWLLAPAPNRRHSTKSPRRGGCCCSALS